MTVTLSGSKQLKFANNIADVCYRKYSGLSKTGKPNSLSEWTLLSAIVKVNGCINGLMEDLTCDVVALGTGSKCIGKNEMSPNGDVLNDSHAEVMARRGFLRYLYHQVYVMYKTGISDIFKTVVDGKCVLKDDVSFHFYTSHTPCGDGSIFEKTQDLDNFGDCLHLNQINNYPDSETECEQRDNVENSEFKSSRGKMHDSFQNVEDVLNNKEYETQSDSQTNYLLFVKAQGSEVLCEQLNADKSSIFDVKKASHSMENDYKRKFPDEFQGKDLICDKISLVSGIKRQSEVESSPSKRIALSSFPLIKKDSGNEDNINQSEEEAKQYIANQCEQVLRDVHRTGAKCVVNEMQDKREHGVGYHVVGVLRTKPGRGDPTLSLSCSDKLARWHAVGVQGALLSLVIAAPICFESIVVGGGCPFSQEAVIRAVVERVRSYQGENARSLVIAQCAMAFIDRRKPQDEKRPCASSIVWCDIPERSLEVAVKGRKQGVTKKVLKTSAGRLKICRKELAMQFIKVITSAPSEALLATGLTIEDAIEFFREKSYKQLKYLAQDYQQSWRSLRALCFPAWPEKPEMMSNFTLDN